MYDCFYNIQRFRGDDYRFSTRRLFRLTSTHELDGPHFYQTVLPSSISPALPAVATSQTLVDSRLFDNE